MELSMWIIADKLGRFAPELSVLSGEMDIRGVRPLLAAEPRREGILYVAPAEPGCVSCTHGEDRMILHCDGVDQALNAILDIFEEFQRWQSALEEAHRRGRDIQHLLDVSAYALPFPIVISDAFGNVLGYARSYDAYGEKDAYWDSVVKRQQMSELVFSEAAYTERRTQMKDWDTTPRIYETMQSRIIGMHLMANEEIAGTMIIIELGGKLTRGVCQLARVFHAAVSRALAIRDDDKQLRAVMAEAGEYLDGRSANTGLLWETVRGFTGGGDGDLELVLLKSLVRADFTFKNNLAYRLARAEDACFALVYHDYVAAVISCGREAEFFGTLWKMLQRSEYVCGVSLPVSDVRGLQSAGNQAALALLSGGQTPGETYRCVDYVYPYLLQKLAGDPAFGPELLHPGLDSLRRYDEKHGTDFYDTLYQYLLLERNVVATAKALGIHRNSMIYRLQRLRQLLDADLEDGDMRMYLLLSYRVRQALEQRRSAPEQSGRFWEDVQRLL